MPAQSLQVVDLIPQLLLDGPVSRLGRLMPGLLFNESGGPFFLTAFEVGLGTVPLGHVFQHRHLPDHLAGLS